RSSSTRGRRTDALSTSGARRSPGSRCRSAVTCSPSRTSARRSASTRCGCGSGCWRKRRPSPCARATERRAPAADPGSAPRGAASRPHAALAELLLERSGHEFHHRDTVVDAEQLDLAMETLRDPGRELDEDVIFFGHGGTPPRRAPAQPRGYLT